MKVNELFISEAISLSDEVGTVRKILVSAIQSGMAQASKTLQKELEVSTASPRDVAEKAAKILYSSQSIAGNIRSQLWAAYRSKGLHSIKYAPLNKVNANVEIGGRSININAKFVGNVYSIIFQDLSRIAHTANDANAVIDALDHYIPSRQLWKLLVSFSATFIHEMVHITQHTRQQHRTKEGLPAEYRSYLTRDKEEFNTAVKELNNRNAQLIYFASPQEIPAYAHNMAIHLIDLATNETPIDEMRSTREVQTAINNLEEIIKTNSSFIVSDTFKAYRNFNRPENPQFYKVYKRFMKRVYQEVMNYRQKLYDRLDEL